MITYILKLFKALNSDDSPAQISAGLVAGMIVGLTPFLSLHNILILFLVCVLRIHITSFFLSFALFSAIGLLFNSLMAGIGASLLSNESLTSFWTSLYQIDFWRLSHFNHTLTLGSLTCGLVLAIPLFFVFKALVVKYRESLLAWVRKTRLVQALKASTLFSKLSAIYSATDR